MILQIYKRELDRLIKILNEDHNDLFLIYMQIKVQFN